MGTLKIQLELIDTPRVASAVYLPSDVVEVRITPRLYRRGSFVRSQSVHFDIDPEGHVFNIEVLGPPRSEWQVCQLQWPTDIEKAEVRFVEPEQCEEEETEVFETNQARDLLHIVFSDDPPTRRVESAQGLVFGISEDGSLSEIWIARLSP